MGVHRRISPTPLGQAVCRHFLAPKDAFRILDGIRQGLSPYELVAEMELATSTERSATVQPGGEYPFGEHVSEPYYMYHRAIDPLGPSVAMTRRPTGTSGRQRITGRPTMGRTA